MSIVRANECAILILSLFNPFYKVQDAYVQILWKDYAKINS